MKHGIQRNLQVAINNIIAYYLFKRFIRIASSGIINCEFVKLNFVARCRLQISAIARSSCAVRFFPRYQ